METFISPLSLSAEQRAANAASMHDRFAQIASRVANDKTQPAKVRAANTRDAQSAKAMARTLRGQS